MNDELLLLANEWPIEQIDTYISQLESRVMSTRKLIADLKYIRKNKQRKVKNLNNGERSGK